MSRGAAWGVVWGAWAGLTAASLALIVAFGSNAPYLDGWDMVPTLTGEQPVTLEWLWSQHNEHRVPLPRLVLLAVNAVAVDFRIAMVLDQLAMAGLALLLLRALQRARGGLRLTDVVVPLLLLNPAQAVNVLWSWQVQFYASTLLVGLVLVTIVRAGDGERDVRPARAALLAGLATVLLPLCGGNGVALVPPLAAWVAWVGLRHRDASARGERLAARAALGLATAAVLLTGLYFVGYEPVPYHTRNPGVAGKLVEIARVLTVGLGTGVRHAWPLVAALAAALLALAASASWRAWRATPGEHERAGGLLALLGALATLGAAIGLGRDGFEARYVTLLAPLWCCAYAALTLHAPTRPGLVGRGALCAATALLLWPNATAGLAHARDVRAGLGGLERDVARGASLDRVVARYGRWLHPHHDVPLDYMPMLRRASVGAFQHLRDPAPALAVALPLTPTHAEQVTWTGGVARLTGRRSRLVYSLPEPLPALGVRLRYRHRSASGEAPYVRVHWRPAGAAEFDPERSWKYSATGDRANWERGAWTRLGDAATTLTVYFDEEAIDAVRVDPDLRPGEFELLELVVLCSPSTEVTPPGFDGTHVTRAGK